jgi:peroxiredoxin
VHSFDYPLLSDPDGAVATQFGVRQELTCPALYPDGLTGPDTRVDM